jgi:DNA primase small subunit
MQDLEMADAPAEADKTRVNLEDLFEDEDSDNEFSSSLPQVKTEEPPSSPPAPV